MFCKWFAVKLKFFWARHLSCKRIEPGWVSMPISMHYAYSELMCWWIRETGWVCVSIGSIEILENLPVTVAMLAVADLRCNAHPWPWGPWVLHLGYNLQEPCSHNGGLPLMVEWHASLFLFSFSPCTGCSLPSFCSLIPLWLPVFFFVLISKDVRMYRSQKPGHILDVSCHLSRAGDALLARKTWS